MLITKQRKEPPIPLLLLQQIFIEHLSVALFVLKNYASLLKQLDCLKSLPYITQHRFPIFYIKKKGRYSPFFLLKNPPQQRLFQAHNIFYNSNNECFFLDGYTICLHLLTSFTGT